MTWRWNSGDVVWKWCHAYCSGKQRMVSPIYQFLKRYEDPLLIVQLASWLLAFANLNASNRETKKHYCVDPRNRKNILNFDDKKCRLFYRMKKVTFCKLLTRKLPMLQKKDINLRNYDCPEEWVNMIIKKIINIYLLTKYRFILKRYFEKHIHYLITVYLLKSISIRTLRILVIMFVVMKGRKWKTRFQPTWTVNSSRRMIT